MFWDSYHYGGHVYDSPSEIIPGLYLGGETDVFRQARLKHLEIDIKNYFSDDFQYFNINASDELSESIIDYADESYEIIYNALESNKKILVHCAAGISRSASLVVLFIMRYKNMSLKDAFNFVKEKRPIVSPNESFRMQLAKYEYLKTGVCSIINEEDEMWNFPELKRWEETLPKSTSKSKIKV